MICGPNKMGNSKTYESNQDNGWNDNIESKRIWKLGKMVDEMKEKKPWPKRIEILDK
jgi:hypothetical protein